MATEENKDVPAVPLPPQEASVEPQGELFPESSIGVTPPEAAPVAPDVASSSPYGAPAADAAPVADAAPAAEEAAPADPYAAAPVAPPVAPPAYTQPAANPYAQTAQAPYSPGAAGATPYNAYAPASPTPPQGLAIAALVCGAVGAFLSFVGLGLLPALAGVILGHIAQKKQPWAKGLWITGLITGYVGVLISAVWIVITIGMFALGAAGSGMSGY